MKRLISIEIDMHEDTATPRRIKKFLELMADQYAVQSFNVYWDRLD